MKISVLSLGILFSLAFVGCQTTTSENPESNTVNTQEIDNNEQESAMDVDAIVAEILTKRKTIETELPEPSEILTNELREKIKQKWSKIHFYTQNGSVVRIKTYPHPSISKRTEEFYLENGKLILAVIQDAEETKRGISEDEMDKMYFYKDGALVKETKNTEEEEYSIKESDGEELLQEVNEYLTIYAKK